MTSEAYIAISSKYVDKVRYIEDSISQIEKISNVEILKISNIYETNFTQNEDYDNLDIVVKIITNLSPWNLLKELKIIEKKNQINDLDDIKNSIDLKILLFGNFIINDKDLTIPMKDLWNSPNILIPLREVCDNSLNNEIDKNLKLCEKNLKYNFKTFSSEKILRL